MAQTPILPTMQNPLRSPTYPQRVHIRERAHWQEVLKTWSDRIEAAIASNASPSEPARKLFAQMLGARDQIFDAARRMPMEVGDLYEEDHHRLEEAVAALERLFEKGSAEGLIFPRAAGVKNLDQDRS